MVDSAAVEGMNRTLGYPMYLIPFLGVAKLLGIIAILIPGYPRIKEWTYAGLMYDLIGATYSIAAVGNTPGTLFMAMLLFVGAGSYIFYHKKIQAFFIQTIHAFKRR